ncbi:MAG TPA: hypothetical protein VLV18_07435 [Terriglobales bacterium]|nr:hypothetical protein [Terriglobales bacterium]
MLHHSLGRAVESIPFADAESSINSKSEAGFSRFSKSRPQVNIDGVVFKCVDETLSSILGLVAKNAVYLRLLSRFAVTRDELPEHIEDFVTVLEEGFGQKPTELISKAIGKRLCTELKVIVLEKSSLPEYLTEIRREL